ncbi:MAG: amidohydrolase family protein, partial [Candidatus Binataceae bacterium]
MHDVVLRNGKIVDGTGAPARIGDVAIDSGIISSAGGRAGAGRREIDAAGLVVAPGFVDIHTHYDGQVTWDPYLTPSSWHGVTTVVMGNCGFTLAPVRAGAHELAVRNIERAEDIAGAALDAGLT